MIRLVSPDKVFKDSVIIVIGNIIQSLIEIKGKDSDLEKMCKFELVQKKIDAVTDELWEALKKYEIGIGLIAVSYLICMLLSIFEIPEDSISYETIRQGGKLM